MREGWKYKKLGEVCDFYRGLTYSGKDEVAFSSNVVLRSNNVDLSTFTLNFEELKYISDTIAIPKDKMLKKGSLLMCMSNGSKQHLGKVAFIDKDYPYAFGGFMGLISPQEDIITPKYLYYYCCSPIYKTFLQSIGNGANINNLRFSDLSQNKIPLPPKSQQEAIVAELDEINSLLALKREQLKTYDKLAQSLFYEMFGDPVENEKGWDIKIWNDVLTIINGKNQKAVENENGIYPICGSGGVMGRANDFLCPSNCTIIGRKGNINKPIFMREPFWNVDTAFGLNSNTSLIEPLFLYFFCKNFDFEHLNKAVTIPSLTKADLLKINIPLPPLALQHQFATRIEQIESQKQQVKLSIERLETLLASRMQYWFE